MQTYKATEPATVALSDISLGKLEHIDHGKRALVLAMILSPYDRQSASHCIFFVMGSQRSLARVAVVLRDRVEEDCDFDL
jgi:hypothetical protein